MASNIRLRVEAVGLEQSMEESYNRGQRAINRRPLKLGANTRGFEQPLGRITGKMSEFQKSMDASVARVFAFGAAVAVINGVQKALGGMAQQAILVEKSLQDVNVILELSASNLRSFGNEMFAVASNTAQGFNTIAEAATEFARQGLGAEETLQRLNDAMILTRLSGLEASQSVSSLTAAINTFKKEALDSTQVVNRLATVDASFAVSSKDLADSLSRAGSAANAAKVNFNELLAVTAAVQERTARGGAVIGNAFKTIFTRLQRSKIREVLEEIGVATENSNGSLRSATQILLDYGRVFNTLSDQQQAYTAEQVAGVRQIGILKALVADLGDEYGAYGRALRIANGTTNEATRRNAELNETVSALMTRATISVQKLAAALGQLTMGEGMQRILGGLESFANIINSVLDPQEGSTLIKGFFKGMGNFISGPGLVLIGAAFAKITIMVGKLFTQALGNIFNINRESMRRQNMEAAILSILQKEEGLYEQMSSSQISMVQKEKILLDVIRRETAERTKQASLLKSLSGMSALRPYTAGEKGIKRGKAEGHIPPKAGGHVPPDSGSARGEKARAAEVGYAAGRVMSMQISSGPVVYNDRERVQYLGGYKDPFISPPENSMAGRRHRQESVQKTGIDPYGLTAAMGLVPNFTGKTGAKWTSKDKRNQALFWMKDYYTQTGFVPSPDQIKGKFGFGDSMQKNLRTQFYTDGLPATTTIGGAVKPNWPKLGMAPRLGRAGISRTQGRGGYNIAGTHRTNILKLIRGAVDQRLSAGPYGQIFWKDEANAVDIINYPEKKGARWWGVPHKGNPRNKNGTRMTAITGDAIGIMRRELPKKYKMQGINKANIAKGEALENSIYRHFNLDHPGDAALDLPYGSLDGVDMATKDVMGVNKRTRWGEIKLSDSAVHRKHLLSKYLRRQEGATTIRLSKFLVEQKRTKLKSGKLGQRKWNVAKHAATSYKPQGFSMLFKTDGRADDTGATTEHSLRSLLKKSPTLDKWISYPSKTTKQERRKIKQQFFGKLRFKLNFIADRVHTGKTLAKTAEGFIPNLAGGLAQQWNQKGPSYLSRGFVPTFAPSPILTKRQLEALAQSENASRLPTQLPRSIRAGVITDAEAKDISKLTTAARIRAGDDVEHASVAKAKAGVAARMAAKPVIDASSAITMLVPDQGGIRPGSGEVMTKPHPTRVKFKMAGISAKGRAMAGQNDITALTETRLKRLAGAVSSQAFGASRSTPTMLTGDASAAAGVVWETAAKHVAGVGIKEGEKARFDVGPAGKADAPPTKLLRKMFHDYSTTWADMKLNVGLQASMARKIFRAHEAGTGPFQKAKKGRKTKAEGFVPSFHSGGRVTGTGPDVPSFLAPGEFVMQKSAVDTIGAPALEQMNAGLVPEKAQGSIPSLAPATRTLHRGYSQAHGIGDAANSLKALWKGLLSAKTKAQFIKEAEKIMQGHVYGKQSVSYTFGTRGITKEEFPKAFSKDFVSKSNPQGYKTGKDGGWSIVEKSLGPDEILHAGAIFKRARTPGSEGERLPTGFRSFSSNPEIARQFSRMVTTLDGKRLTPEYSGRRDLGTGKTISIKVPKSRIFSKSRVEKFIDRFGLKRVQQLLNNSLDGRGQPSGGSSVLKDLFMDTRSFTGGGSFASHSKEREYTQVLSDGLIPNFAEGFIPNFNPAAGLAGMRMKVPKFLEEMARKIKKAGGEIQIVGGAPRDHLLGMKPKDWDVEVFGLGQNKLQKLLKEHGGLTGEGLIGKDFGVFKTKNRGQEYEFSLPRREVRTGKGHKDFDISVDPHMSKREAAERRDLTLNAISYDPLKREFIDPLGGIKDLQAGVMRPTSGRFKEDPLRVLRAMQFAGRYGFSADKKLIEYAKSMAGEFKSLPVERVRDEWFKWASKSTSPDKGLEFLKQSGWIKHFPEINKLSGIPQNPKFHPEGDVFEHVKLVTKSMAENKEWQRLGENSRSRLMFTALTHDFGKATHTQITPAGITSRGHAEAGIAPMGKFLERIMSKGEARKLSKQIGPYIKDHMFHAGFPQNITEKSIRRLSKRISEGGGDMEEFQIMMGADLGGRGASAHRSLYKEDLSTVKTMVKRQGLEHAPPVRLVLGRHLIKEGLAPGPKMGRALAQLENAQIDGKFNNLQGGLQYFRDLQRRGSFGAQGFVPNFEGSRQASSREQGFGGGLVPNFASGKIIPFPTQPNQWIFKNLSWLRTGGKGLEKTYLEYFLKAGGKISKGDLGRLMQFGYNKGGLNQYGIKAENTMGGSLHPYSEKKDLDKILKKYKTEGGIIERARGYVPNFTKKTRRTADALVPFFSDKLKEAVQAEQAAGVPAGRVRVGFDQRIPGGIGVYDAAQGSLPAAIGQHGGITSAMQDSSAGRDLLSAGGDVPHLAKRYTPGTAAVMDTDVESTAKFRTQRRATEALAEFDRRLRGLITNISTGTITERKANVEMAGLSKTMKLTSQSGRSLSKNFQQQAKDAGQQRFQQKFGGMMSFGAFMLPMMTGYLPETQGGAAGAAVGGLKGAAQGAGIGALLASGGNKKMMIAGGALTVIATALGAIGGYRKDAGALKKELDQISSSNTQAVNGLTKYSQLQGQLNEAYKSGDIKNQIKLGKALDSQFRDIGDDQVRAQIVAAGGDVNKLSEALEKLRDRAVATKKSIDIMMSGALAKDDRWALGGSVPVAAIAEKLNKLLPGDPIPIAGKEDNKRAQEEQVRLLSTLKDLTQEQIREIQNQLGGEAGGLGTAALTMGVPLEQIGKLMETLGEEGLKTMIGAALGVQIERSREREALDTSSREGMSFQRIRGAVEDASKAFEIAAKRITKSFSTLSKMEENLLQSSRGFDEILGQGNPGERREELFGFRREQTQTKGFLQIEEAVMGATEDLIKGQGKTNRELADALAELFSGAATEWQRDIQDGGMPLAGISLQGKILETLKDLVRAENLSQKEFDTITSKLQEININTALQLASLRSQERIAQRAQSAKELKQALESFSNDFLNEFNNMAAFEHITGTPTATSRGQVADSIMSVKAQADKMGVELDPALVQKAVEGRLEYQLARLLQGAGLLKSDPMQGGLTLPGKPAGFNEAFKLSTDPGVEELLFPDLKTAPGGTALTDKEWADKVSISADDEKEARNKILSNLEDWVRQQKKFKKLGKEGQDALLGFVKVLGNAAITARRESVVGEREGGREIMAAKGLWDAMEDIDLGESFRKQFGSLFATQKDVEAKKKKDPDSKLGVGDFMGGASVKFAKLLEKTGMGQFGLLQGLSDIKGEMVGANNHLSAIEKTLKDGLGNMHLLKDIARGEERVAAWLGTSVQTLRDVENSMKKVILDGTKASVLTSEKIEQVKKTTEIFGKENVQKQAQAIEVITTFLKGEEVSEDKPLPLKLPADVSAELQALGLKDEEGNLLNASDLYNVFLRALTDTKVTTDDTGKIFGQGSRFGVLRDDRGQFRETAEVLGEKEKTGNLDKFETQELAFSESIANNLDNQTKVLKDTDQINKRSFNQNSQSLNQISVTTAEAKQTSETLEKIDDNIARLGQKGSPDDTGQIELLKEWRIALLTGTDRLLKESFGTKQFMHVLKALDALQKNAEGAANELGKVERGPKKFQDLVTKEKNKAQGFIPNFGEDPLTAAIGRETSALSERGFSNPSSLVYVGEHSAITGNDYGTQRAKGFIPSFGIGVFNKIDEPGGPGQGINRARQEGKDINTYGMNRAQGSIPNFKTNWRIGEEDASSYDTSKLSPAFEKGDLFIIRGDNEDRAARVWQYTGGKVDASIDWEALPDEAPQKGMFHPDVLGKMPVVSSSYFENIPDDHKTLWERKRLRNINNEWTNISLRGPTEQKVIPKPIHGPVPPGEEEKFDSLKAIQDAKEEARLEEEKRRAREAALQGATLVTKRQETESDLAWLVIGAVGGVAAFGTYHQRNRLARVMSSNPYPKLEKQMIEAAGKGDVDKVEAIKKQADDFRKAKVDIAAKPWYKRLWKGMRVVGDPGGFSSKTFEASFDSLQEAFKDPDKGLTRAMEEKAKLPAGETWYKKTLDWYPANPRKTLTFEDIQRMAKDGGESVKLPTKSQPYSRSGRVDITPRHVEHLLHQEFAEAGVAKQKAVIKEIASLKGDITRPEAIYTLLGKLNPDKFKAPKDLHNVLRVQQGGGATKREIALSEAAQKRIRMPGTGPLKEASTPKKKLVSSRIKRARGFIPNFANTLEGRGMVPNFQTFEPLDEVLDNYLASQPGAKGETYDEALKRELVTPEAYQEHARKITALDEGTYSDSNLKNMATYNPERAQRILQGGDTAIERQIADNRGKFHEKFTVAEHLEAVKLEDRFMDSYEKGQYKSIFMEAAFRGEFNPEKSEWFRGHGAATSRPLQGADKASAGLETYYREKIGSPHKPRKTGSITGALEADTRLPQMAEDWLALNGDKYPNQKDAVQGLMKHLHKGGIVRPGPGIRQARRTAMLDARAAALQQVPPPSQGIKHIPENVPGKPKGELTRIDGKIRRAEGFIPNFADQMGAEGQVPNFATISDLLEQFSGGELGKGQFGIVDLIKSLGKRPALAVKRYIAQNSALMQSLPPEMQELGQKGFQGWQKTAAATEFTQLKELREFMDKRSAAGEPGVNIVETVGSQARALEESRLITKAIEGHSGLGELKQSAGKADVLGALGDQKAQLDFLETLRQGVVKRATDAGLVDLGRIEGTPFDLHSDNILLNNSKLEEVGEKMFFDEGFGKNEAVQWMLDNKGYTIIDIDAAVPKDLRTPEMEARREVLTDYLEKNRSSLGEDSTAFINRFLEAKPVVRTADNRPIKPSDTERDPGARQARRRARLDARAAALQQVVPPSQGIKHVPENVPGKPKGELTRIDGKIRRAGGFIPSFSDKFAAKGIIPNFVEVDMDGNRITIPRNLINRKRPPSKPPYAGPKYKGKAASPLENPGRNLVSGNAPPVKPTLNMDTGEEFLALTLPLKAAELEKYFRELAEYHEARRLDLSQYGVFNTGDAAERQVQDLTLRKGLEDVPTTLVRRDFPMGRTDMPSSYRGLASAKRVWGENTEFAGPLEESTGYSSRQKEGRWNEFWGNTEGYSFTRQSRPIETKEPAYGNITQRIIAGAESRRGTEFSEIENPSGVQQGVDRFARYDSRGNKGYGTDSVSRDPGLVNVGQALLEEDPWIERPFIYAGEDYEALASGDLSNLDKTMPTFVMDPKFGLPNPVYNSDEGKEARDEIRAKRKKQTPLIKQYGSQGLKHGGGDVLLAASLVNPLTLLRTGATQAALRGGVRGGIGTSIKTGLHTAKTTASDMALSTAVKAQTAGRTLLEKIVSTASKATRAASGQTLTAVPGLTARKIGIQTFNKTWEITRGHLGRTLPDILSFGLFGASRAGLKMAKGQITKKQFGKELTRSGVTGAAFDVGLPVMSQYDRLGDGYGDQTWANAWAVYWNNPKNPLKDALNAASMMTDPLAGYAMLTEMATWGLSNVGEEGDGTMHRDAAELLMAATDAATDLLRRKDLPGIGDALNADKLTLGKHVESGVLSKRYFADNPLDPLSYTRISKRMALLEERRKERQGSGKLGVERYEKRKQVYEDMSQTKGSEFIGRALGTVGLDKMDKELAQFSNELHKNTIRSKESKRGTLMGEVGEGGRHVYRASLGEHREELDASDAMFESAMTEPDTMGQVIEAYLQSASMVGSAIAEESAQDLITPGTLGRTIGAIEGKGVTAGKVSEATMRKIASGTHPELGFPHGNEMQLWNPETEELETEKFEKGYIQKIGDKLSALESFPYKYKAWRPTAEWENAGKVPFKAQDPMTGKIGAPGSLAEKMVVRKSVGQLLPATMFTDPSEDGWSSAPSKEDFKDQLINTAMGYLTDAQTRANLPLEAEGFIPNFANPLKAAIGREQSAGIPSYAIRVEQSPRLANFANPMGLAVTNIIDEPLGVNQGIERSVRMGMDPKSHGMSGGFIPNFKGLQNSILENGTWTEVDEATYNEWWKEQNALARGARDFNAAGQQPTPEQIEAQKNVFMKQMQPWFKAYKKYVVGADPSSVLGDRHEKLLENAASTKQAVDDFQAEGPGGRFADHEDWNRELIRLKDRYNKAEATLGDFSQSLDGGGTLSNMSEGGRMEFYRYLQSRGGAEEIKFRAGKLRESQLSRTTHVRMEMGSANELYGGGLPMGSGKYRVGTYKGEQERIEYFKSKEKAKFKSSIYFDSSKGTGVNTPYEKEINPNDIKYSDETAGIIESIAGKEKFLATRSKFGGLSSSQSYLQATSQEAIENKKKYGIYATTSRIEYLKDQGFPVEELSWTNMKALRAASQDERVVKELTGLGPSQEERSVSVFRTKKRTGDEIFSEMMNGIYWQQPDAQGQYKKDSRSMESYRTRAIKALRGFRSEDAKPFLQKAFDAGDIKVSSGFIPSFSTRLGAEGRIPNFGIGFSASEKKEWAEKKERAAARNEQRGLGRAEKEILYNIKTFTPYWESLKTNLPDKVPADTSSWSTETLAREKPEIFKFFMNYVKSGTMKTDIDVKRGVPQQQAAQAAKDEKEKKIRLDESKILTRTSRAQRSSGDPLLAWASQNGYVTGRDIYATYGMQRRASAEIDARGNIKSYPQNMPADLRKTPFAKQKAYVEWLFKKDGFGIVDKMSVEADKRAKEAKVIAKKAMMEEAFKEWKFASTYADYGTKSGSPFEDRQNVYGENTVDQPGGEGTREQFERFMEKPEAMEQLRKSWTDRKEAITAGLAARVGNEDSEYAYIERVPVTFYEWDSVHETLENWARMDDVGKEKSLRENFLDGKGDGEQDWKTYQSFVEGWFANHGQKVLLGGIERLARNTSPLENPILNELLFAPEGIVGAPGSGAETQTLQEVRGAAIDETFLNWLHDPEEWYRPTYEGRLKDEITEPFRNKETGYIDMSEAQVAEYAANMENWGENQVKSYQEAQEAIGLWRAEWTAIAFSKDAFKFGGDSTIPGSFDHSSAFPFQSLSVMGNASENTKSKILEAWHGSSGYKVEYMQSAYAEHLGENAALAGFGGEVGTSEYSGNDVWEMSDINEAKGSLETDLLGRDYQYALSPIGSLFERTMGLFNKYAGAPDAMRVGNAYDEFYNGPKADDPQRDYKTWQGSLIKWYEKMGQRLDLGGMRPQGMIEGHIGGQYGGGADYLEALMDPHHWHWDPDSFGLNARSTSDLPGKAKGFIPSFANKFGLAGLQEMAMARAAGYTPGEPAEMNIPGLAEGLIPNFKKVIYNKAEKVKTFPGLSQPAIMPPQSSQAGAAYAGNFAKVHPQIGNPYTAAEGHIPNFVDLDKASVGIDFSKMEGVASQLGASFAEFKKSVEDLIRQGVRNVFETKVTVAGSADLATTIQESLKTTLSAEMSAWLQRELPGMIEKSRSGLFGPSAPLT